MNLQLVGVTALEDLLQEKCHETIKDLRKAKIKVWMLTGDKGETAKTIGIAAGLIDDDHHNILKITGQTIEELGRELQQIDSLMSSLPSNKARPNNLSQVEPSDQDSGDQKYETRNPLSVEELFASKPRDGQKASAKKTGYALLINGSSLSNIFGDEELSVKIAGLFDRVDSVVVYRSSPDEKA